MIRFVKAIYFGAVALLRAYDDTKEPCAAGHVQHRTWSACPKCAIIRSQKNHGITRAEEPLVSLRIKDQKGDLRTLTFPQGQFQLGHDALAEVTLTPFHQRYPSEDRFELSVDERQVSLTALGKEKFSVGGRMYTTSSLYDRDRVELLGTHFQIVILPGGTHA